MNEGIITKIYLVEKDQKQETVFNIRLDRNVKINDIEYNIYVDADNKKSYLFRTDTKVKVDFQGVTVGIGNKYDFELDCKKTKDIRTTAISYER